MKRIIQGISGGKDHAFGFSCQPFPVTRMGDGDKSTHPLITTIDKNLPFQKRISFIYNNLLFPERSIGKL
jgi:hypothetical protein